MRYFALAVDYDDTLASNGRVPESTETALESLRATGRRLILVTGRRMIDLTRVWPGSTICDAIVAENGGILHIPRTREMRRLARRPDERLLNRLSAAKVDFVTGEVVIALSSMDAASALEVLRETGLDYHIVFNGDSAMVLPAGVNKAFGLAAALRQLELSFHEVVGIGNEANDRAFLERCECAVAVANALPSVKEVCDLTTRGRASRGVEELIAELVDDDLGRQTLSLPRSSISLGRVETHRYLRIPTFGLNLLIAGPSGSGKSTFATGLMERLINKDYQVFVFDPEGDYVAMPDLVSLGDRRRPPSNEEILTVLDNPTISVSANLLGIPFYDRPHFFVDLMVSLQAMRSRTGRPHWVIVDEAHHFLPESWRLVPLTMPVGLGEVVLITVRPQEVAPDAISMMNIAVAVGPNQLETLSELSEYAAEPLVENQVPASDPGREVLYWDLRRKGGPLKLGIVRGSAELLRHHRKYAEGDLDDMSFHFRGAHEALNLKAQNLMLFVQIAEGIDDDTWMHHLRQHDYSTWIRTAVKDTTLADKIEKIESRRELGPKDSKGMICDLLRRRYSL